MTPFQWGTFSQFVDAAVVNDSHLHLDRNGSIEFAAKCLDINEGEGRIDYLYQPDIRVIVADFTFETNREYEILDNGLVRFHFGYDVSISPSMGGDVLHDIADNPAGVLIATPDQPMREQIPAGKRQTFVTVACKSEWLDSTFGVRLLDHVGGDEEQDAAWGSHYPIRYGRELRHIVSAMVSGRMPGRLRAAFLAAKAQEMLVFALGDLQETRADRSYKLTARDIAAVRDARDILEQGLASPPDIAMLSRRVGINRTKLFYGFKRIYGMSATQFIHLQRMDHARRLLIETDRSISDIALAVGYEHSCNFSTRFKAHFDCSPREVRGPLYRSEPD